MFSSVERVIERYVSRCCFVGRLEEENNRLYSQVKILTEEREEDRKRIHDLVNEVAKLTMEKQERYSYQTSCILACFPF